MIEMRITETLPVVSYSQYVANVTSRREAFGRPCVAPPGTPQERSVKVSSVKLYFRIGATHIDTRAELRDTGIIGSKSNSKPSRG
jgi:hypothetical protein